MEHGQVGNNAVTACPYCDELFTVKTSQPGEVSLDLNRLMAMHEEHMAASPACQKAKESRPSLEEQLAGIRPAVLAGDKAHRERMESHPDNGRLGWWRVEGIHHDATARASSAPEAISKCEAAGCVGSWESAEARFLGEELPDVF